MTSKEVLTELRKRGNHVWQLCHCLGWSRSTYYKRSHNRFKGYENKVRKALKEID